MQWTSEHDFRLSDPRRRRPVEVEFGGRWFEAADEAPWRVCLLESTGELVVMQAAEGDVEAGAVVLLATGVHRVEVERALRGWWQVCGHRGSLPWVRHRVDELMRGR